MPKQKNKSSDLVIIPQKVIFSKPQLSDFKYVVIPTEQLVFTAELFDNLAKSYSAVVDQLQEMNRKILESKINFAKKLSETLIKISTFDNVNVLIEVAKQQSSLQTTRIFVQPNKPYEPPKSLPSPKSKYNLPLTSVKIEGKGFTAEGEYIKGMTRKSEVGQLFELMIRSDLKGKIPDELIDEIKGSYSDEIDYRARSYVMRDLKKILAGNKLKLDIERHRAIEKYYIKGLTKYIRKPRKVKKSVIKAKIN